MASQQLITHIYSAPHTHTNRHTHPQIHTHEKQFLTSAVTGTGAFIYCTWWDPGGDGGGCDHAPSCSSERSHLYCVHGGGGEAGQLVLQGGVGQGAFLAT